MGDHHHSGAGRVSRDKCVDAGLVIHDVEFRHGHGHATGNGHFLYDIAQFAFIAVAGVWVNRPCTHHFGNAASTSCKVYPAYE